MSRAGEPIAIVGVGCVLPDAFDEATFARNVLEGRSAIRELRHGRWSWREYLEPRHGFDTTHSIRGAAIENYAFDWKRFRIPPADAELVNPMQLRTLDAGVQALSSVKTIPRETTGVILGGTGLGWQPDSAIRIRLGEILESLERSSEFAALDPARRAQVLAEVRARVDRRFGPVSEDNVVNASVSVAAGRIHMHFDLRGPHFAVDAGFASSLAAVDVGVRMLRDHTLDCAVVGGVSEILTPLELVAFARLGGLARDAVRPFDVSATGTLLGEGVVVFALKRLEDARRDGDRILALIRGVGGASDGRGRSLVAPHADGQALAMRRALQDAEVDPSTVGFVECHATGTPVGDASEIEALGRVYGGSGRPLLLGSAKPFVGHLRGAAGAVGMLRAVQALGSGVVPAQLGFERGCPELFPEGTPLRVPRSATELARTGGADVRRAGVSAFGFGGVGYHVVLEEYREGAASQQRMRFRSVDEPEPIAIVGLGGVFPGGDSVPAFFESLLEARDSTREVPRERWDVGRYFDPDKERNETCYTKLGCFLDALPQPVARWQIPPVALPTVDPGQLLVLRAAEEAVADSGLDLAREDHDRVSVHLAFLPYQGKKFLADIRVNVREVAREMVGALRDAGVAERACVGIVDEAMGRFRETLPEISEDTMPGYLGSVNAARITRLYDLHGPHFVVDSACASSHAALMASIQALRHGLSDVALSGGVWCDMLPEFFVAACRFQALSATGSTPFSAEADGFIPGEGGGVVVLMRMRDALERGLRVRAVLRSVAGASDGKGRSVLAPNPVGEATAMRRAIAQAGVPAGEIDYVECHGTGTALGDVVEVEAVGSAYAGGRESPILIGSVKSNVGHMNAAAGIAGLIKTVCAIERGLIPASLKADVPNPAIDFARSEAEVVRRTRAWPDHPDRPRRAGVSGFGVGGTNMHMIVEQFRPIQRTAEREPPRERPRPVRAEALATVPIAVATASTIEAALEELERLARIEGDRYSEALAEAQAAPRAASGVRVAIVARSPDELSRRLGLLRRSRAPFEQARALAAQGIFCGRIGRELRVALMFPGQGSQYPDMMREAMDSFPELRATLDEADRIYQRLAGRPLSASFLVDDVASYAQRDEDIHCAVFVVACAMARLLADRGLRIDAVVGQSAGELAALVAAGVLSFEDALTAMRVRTTSVLALPTHDAGRMVALSCGAERARALIAGLPGYAAIAADNSPTASIVSVDGRASTALTERMQTLGIEGTVLAVSHGYHSELIAGARPSYRRTLDQLDFRVPRLPVVSTISGGFVEDHRPESFAAALERQYVEPVRLREAIESLHASGIGLFVECGPKWPLSNFVGDILEGREHVAHATLHPKVGETEQLLRTMACAYAHGAMSRFDRVGVAPTSDDPTRRRRSSMATQQAHERNEGNAPATALADGADQRPGAADGDAAFRRDLVALVRSVSRALDDFAARWGDPSLEARTPEIRAARPAESARPSSPPGPSPVREAASPRRTPRGEVRRVFAEKLAARTGYPLDMLEDDLDLEADLGIDTVKQIAVMGETREHFGLPVDPAFKLRHHPSIAAFAQYLEKRLGLEPSIPPAAPVSSPPLAPAPKDVVARSVRPGVAVPGYDEVREVFVAKLVAKTGYPSDMLEDDLDLEADLGIDTVKQIAVMGETRERFGLPVDPRFKLRHHPTIRSFCAYLLERLGSAGGHQGGPPRGGSGGGGRAHPGPSNGASLAARIAFEEAREPRGSLLTSERWVTALAAARGASPGFALRELRSVEGRPRGETPRTLVLAAEGAFQAVGDESVVHGRVSLAAPARADRDAPRLPEWLRELADVRTRWNAVQDPEDPVFARLHEATTHLGVARAPRFDEVVARVDTPPSASPEQRIALVYASTLEASRLLHVACTGQLAEPERIDSFVVESLPAEGRRFGVRARLRSVGRIAVECVADDGTRIARAEGVLFGDDGRTTFEETDAAAPGPVVLERRAWLRLRRELAPSFEHEVAAP